MGDVLAGLDHVTAEWLTSVLRRKGHLESGQVVSVQQKAIQTHPVSVVARLEIRCTDDAPDSVPSRLFLKTTRPDLSRAMGQREVTFYDTVAAHMPDPPAPRCYDAVYSAEARKFHLLLEDLSDSHFQNEWPVPPSVPHCEAVVDCLAALHGYWWDHPSLKDLDPLPTDADLERAFRPVEETLSGFLDVLGDRVSEQGRAIYDRVVRSLPSLYSKRLVHSRGLTLLHGDSHFWNVMLPRSGEDQVRLIDWDGWEIGCGPMDLAYMIALHWYPERRARLEQRLVKRYHARLLAQGVDDYDWEACWTDYRLFVLRNILIPMSQWSRGLGAYLWWGHLERSMLAVQDLHCLELL